MNKARVSRRAADYRGLESLSDLMRMLNRVGNSDNVTCSHIADAKDNDESEKMGKMHCDDIFGVEEHRPKRSCARNC